MKLERDLLFRIRILASLLLHEQAANGIALVALGSMLLGMCAATVLPEAVVLALAIVVFAVGLALLQARHRR